MSSTPPRALARTTPRPFQAKSTPDKPTVRTNFPETWLWATPSAGYAYQFSGICRQLAQNQLEC